MTPFAWIAGAIALVGLLWAKGYLGFADIFGIAASAANPASILPKATAQAKFAEAVKLAREEAFEEIAHKIASTMRSQVVRTHVDAFSGAGPSAQTTPDASKPAPKDG